MGNSYQPVPFTPAALPQGPNGGPMQGGLQSIFGGMQMPPSMSPFGPMQMPTIQAYKPPEGSALYQGGNSLQMQEMQKQLAALQKAQASASMGGNVGHWGTTGNGRGSTLTWMPGPANGQYAPGMFGSPVGGR